MANLLSPESQKNIRQEYRLRLAITAVFALMVIIVFAGILLVPSFLLSSVKATESEARLDILHKTPARNLEEEIKAVVIKTNADTAFLSESGNQTFSVGGFVEHLLETKPDSIAITGIFYEKSKAKDNVSDKASIRGIAANREALSAYAASLGSDRYFAEAVLPVSGFVQEKDIEFSVSLKIKARGK
ncbi:MAG: hypothetical protein HZC03_01485 [Candidatus Lloydbacteria bacterium]|nr:hypothetical protein [Candidatus Lloydbacteria bacterium]